MGRQSTFAAATILCAQLAALPSQAQNVIGPIQNPDNGHWYQMVEENATWEEATTRAAAMTFQGLQGHLATITSDGETRFIANNFLVACDLSMWIGGFQDFGAPDYSEPAGGWRWVTGEPWSYTNWHVDEPNNDQGDERYLQLSGNCTWNDAPPAHLRPGFVVEFEPLSADWQKLVGPWDPICDGSFGAIVVSPIGSNIVYVGSSHPTRGCGVFMTTDRGRSWVAVNEGLPVRPLPSPHYPPISAIAIAPSDPQVLYVGTADQESGELFRSGDGGATWRASSGSGFFRARIRRAVLDIDIDPSDADKLIVGALGGIYASQNAGETWTRVRAGVDVPPRRDYFLVISRAPSAPSIIYASGMSIVDGPALCARDDCTSLVSGFPINPIMSSDGGTSWSAIRPPRRFAFLSDLVVDTVNPTHVHAATRSWLFGAFGNPIPIPNMGVFSSVDGGRTWQPTNDVDNVNMAQYPIHDLALDESVPGTIYAVTGFDGVFKSEDAGQAWEHISSSGLPPSTFVWTIAVGEESLYATSSSGLFIRLK